MISKAKYPGKRRKLLKLMPLILLFNVFNSFAQYPNSDFKVLVNNQNLSIEETLSEYIKFESLSGNEKRVGEWLKTICIDNGLYITQMGNKDGNYNFSASIYPLSKNLPNIIFLIHMDVVPADDSVNWTYPPFSGLITDTEVWGRGAIDNKGPGIMQLYSVIKLLRETKEESLPYNVTFLAVSCEEIICDGGVKYVVDNYLDSLHPSVVICEGATELGEVVGNNSQNIFGISIAEKRPLWLKLSLEKGVSGHGCVTPIKYPDKEMTIALNQLVNFKRKVLYNDLNISLLKELAAMKKGMERLILKHPRFFKPIIIPQLRKQPELLSLFTNTITLTNIKSSNDAINMISAKSTALIDSRLLPDQSNSDFILSIQRKLKNDDIKIHVLKSFQEVPPSDVSSFYFDQMKRSVEMNYANSRIIPIILPNYNDVGHFRAENKTSFSINPFILSAAHICSIHNTNERIPISCLYLGMETYYSFLNNCIINATIN